MCSRCRLPLLKAPPPGPMNRSLTASGISSVVGPYKKFYVSLPQSGVASHESLRRVRTASSGLISCGLILFATDFGNHLLQPSASGLSHLPIARCQYSPTSYFLQGVPNRTSLDILRQDRGSVPQIFRASTQRCSSCRYSRSTICVSCRTDKVSFAVIALS